MTSLGKIDCDKVNVNCTYTIQVRDYCIGTGAFINCRCDSEETLTIMGLHYWPEFTITVTS